MGLGYKSLINKGWLDVVCVLQMWAHRYRPPGWRGSPALPQSYQRHQQPATTAGSVACGPTGGLQASSRLLHWSIQPTGFFPGEGGKQLFWAMTAPSSSWACPPTQSQNTAAVDKRYVYFGGNWGSSCNWVVSHRGLYPAWWAPSGCSLWQFLGAGVVQMASRLCLVVTAVVGEGKDWPLLERERQDATHGEEGGRWNCKPKSIPHSCWG